MVISWCVDGDLMDVSGDLMGICHGFCCGDFMGYRMGINGIHHQYSDRYGRCLKICWIPKNGSKWLFEW